MQTREGEYGGVTGLGTTKGLILRSASTLVADKVGPCAAKACGAHGLVGVDHDVVVGRAANSVEIVVDLNLAVVVLATGHYIAYVAALDGVVAIVAHQLVGAVHVLLVVHDRRRRLVVHHQAHTLGVGIVIEGADVEVRIRRKEVEDILLRVAAPVLPAYIPAFHEHLAEAVLRSEVDVAAHVGVVG